MEGFMEIEGMTESVAQQLVEQGYLSYDDLSVIEPDALMEMGNWSEEEVDAIVEQADTKALEQEAAEEERKHQDKLERERKATEELDRKEGVVTPPPPPPAEISDEPLPEVSSEDSVPPVDLPKEEPGSEEQTGGNV